MVLKNGELSTPEIRKLIRAHNVLVSINIPNGSSREQIIKILDKKGYTINHKFKAIIRKDKKTDKVNVNLTRADRVLKKPEKTVLQKQKAVEAKEKKEEIQKKKVRELKKEAVKKAMTNKPDPKPKPVKKPDPKPKPVKKPVKKDDDVRPKEKVGKPRFDPNKVQYTVKGQLQLEDKKKGQVVKKPVKVALKDKLIAKDKKAIADEKKAIQQRKKDKKPYKPIAEEGSLKEEMLRLNDYFVEDKNKIGKTFKTIKQVNSAIGKLFSSIKGEDGDALASLSTSERKYFIKLMNSMLRFSTKEKTGVEVTPRALQKYKGWFSESSVKDGSKKVRTEEKAPEVLKKKLMKAGSQLEDKPAIRARELADKAKAKAKADAKKGGKKVEEVVLFEEESSHSDTLKNARKSLYRIINQAVVDAKKIKSKDFVELKQRTDFYRIYSDKYIDILEEQDDDDMEILEEEWDDVIDVEFNKQLDEILAKNRKETNWVKAKPALKPIQDKYIEFMKKFKADNGAADFQSAKRQKDLILKHYKPSDVPAVPDPKPKFRIDKSKQPNQTPSKVDIKIKPDSNTKKIEPKKKEEKYPDLLEIMEGFLDRMEDQVGSMKMTDSARVRYIKSTATIVSNLKKGKSRFTDNQKNIIIRALDFYMKGKIFEEEGVPTEKDKDRIKIMISKFTKKEPKK